MDSIASLMPPLARTNRHPSVILKRASGLDAAVHSKGKPMTFGEFVAAVYRTWGKRRGKGMVQLAIETQVIKFHGKKPFVIC